MPNSLQWIFLFPFVWGRVAVGSMGCIQVLDALENVSRIGNAGLERTVAYFSLGTRNCSRPKVPVFPLSNNVWEFRPLHILRVLGIARNFTFTYLMGCEMLSYSSHILVLFFYRMVCLYSLIQPLSYILIFCHLYLLQILMWLVFLFLLSFVEKFLILL